MTNDDGMKVLNVVGTGEVKAMPDIATIRLAVLTQAKTATDAVQSNAAAANQVIAAVSALGVPVGDMRTTGLSVYPVMRFDPATGHSTIDGYRAENSIAVTVPIDLAGTVFDSGVAAGANESSGITFGLANERPYREEALRVAVEVARADAEAVACAMSIALGSARAVDVAPEAGPIYRRMELRAVEASGTPILPGELTITAEVRVAFEFEPLSK